MKCILEVIETRPTGIAAVNHQNLSAFIWSVVDLLRGDYKQSDYGKVILPFTVLRRLDCVLEPTKSAVLVEFGEKSKAGLNPEPFLLRKSGQGDQEKTRTGYEIPFNRHFYVFEPPRDLAEIDADLRPLKHIVRFKTGGTPSKENPNFWNGNVRWASAKDLKSDVLHGTLDHITEVAIESDAATLVPAGSVLVLVRGMMLARTFPVVIAGAPMAINQDLKALSAGVQIRSEYLAWLLRGTDRETRARIDEAGHGTKALRMETWTSMVLCVPPESEQYEIASFIEQATIRIDHLIGEAERAITLLQERRAAPISAAVTGKIDVRGIVAEKAEAA